MNPQKARPASAVLASLSVEALVRMLTENADEPYAREIAYALRGVGGAPITTTRALADAVRRAMPRGTPPADAAAAVRRTFQALRIATNEEFLALDTFLARLPGCLAPGGRAVILTFHSGEDRRVKRALKEGAASGDYAAVARTCLRPTAAERIANPRSGCAKLRCGASPGGGGAPRLGAKEEREHAACSLTVLSPCHLYRLAGGRFAQAAATKKRGQFCVRPS